MIFFFYIDILYSQSKTYGNLFIQGDTEYTIFTSHEFKESDYGIKGIIGTKRSEPIGIINFVTNYTRFSEKSYVDGYVRSLMDGTFVFPVGDGGIYRPVKLSNSLNKLVAYYRSDPSLAITNYYDGSLNTFSLPQGAPFISTDSDIISSVVEYWDINGDEPTKISVFWDEKSELTSKITSFEVLSIIGWSGNKWVKIPSKVDYISFYNGKISTPFSGSISTEVALKPDDFEVYTLGILPSFDMQLVLSINKEVTYKNDIISFHIDITNNGGDDINDLEFTLPLPIGTNFIQTDLENDVTYDSKTGTFTVDRVKPNNSSKIIFILEVSSDIPNDELIKATIKDISYTGVDSGVSPDVLSIELPVIKADFGVLFDVITPNGDNLNEYLRLKGVGKGEDIMMRIYDTNGILVYYSDYYGKNYEFFEGYSNIGMFLGSKERLLEGNYYYNIKNSDGEEKVGYIYLRY